MITAEQVLSYFNLHSLPGEGGYFAETYRADEIIPANALPERYGKDKTYGTAILYMLTPDTFSEIHRLPTDEIFHFYAGDPVDMLLLKPDGTHETVTLGSDFLNGQKVQFVVPRGIWQGCSLREGGKWALMGTTVSPGFDFSDYEDGNRDELIRKYPEAQDRILQLTRKEETVT